MKYAIYTILICMTCVCFLASMASTETFRKSAVWKSMSFRRQSLLREIHERDKQMRTPDLRPVSESVLVGSTYGMRRHPIFKRWQMHWGIDYPAAVGTPVRAVASGKVSKVVAKYRRKGYGKYVRITHDETYSSLYAHLSKVAVTNGQTVEKGDTIGYSGNTGLSTNPHLHFELRKNGKPIDPLSYWKKLEQAPEHKPGVQQNNFSKN